MSRAWRTPSTFKSDLERMNSEAEETERRTDALVDTLDGKKTAIRDMARETKGEGVEMMKTYLGDEEEALDGFEFLGHGRGGRAVPLGDRREDGRHARRQSRSPSSRSGPSASSAPTSRPSARRH